ncbi:MAG: DUF1549 and DUF1553 domain-containing protein [Gemmataceae bacterium]
MTRTLTLALLLLAALPLRAELPVQSLAVFPEQVKLGGPRQSMHLIVTGVRGPGRELVDLTHSAKITTLDRKIVVVNDGIISPRGNGRTVIVVQAGGLEKRIAVAVTGQDRPEPISFMHEVLPAFTKQGCNAGACHGSPSGKGGFRLSLRGYLAELDEATLIREAMGRRVNRHDPEQSLLLLKPLMRIAHDGDLRLKPSAPAYRVLRGWIAEGCASDRNSASACNKIEVFPKSRELHAPHRRQQLVVLAHFADGSVRDVTCLVDFSSTDESVARINASGLVECRGRGETALLARFEEHIAVCNLTYLEEVEGFRWPELAEHNYIDRIVHAKLRKLQIPPSELCGDAEFVRRVYLDLLGVLPTVTEVKAFLEDKNADKRTQLIDRLLARPEFAEFWAMKWADLFQVKASKLSPTGVEKFHGWLVEAARNNMPYDRFARELLTAKGSTFANPPANYFRASADTQRRAENTAQLFLGVRIQCARCHNHPYDRWTQDNYYGLGAFFHPVELKAMGPSGEMEVMVVKKKEMMQPGTGQPAHPWLPHQGQVQVKEGQDGRNIFVDWLARPENPYFAHVEVNRIWAHLFGRGIVDPVDDFRESNPAAHAELLDALAADFIKSGYDRRHMIRTVVRSRVYQLSSRAHALNRDDEKYFSHARARLLGAEVLLDALCQVTDVPERYAGRPAGTRAVQLPAPDQGHDFLKVFGQPGRESVCSCERSGEPNLSQALELLSGERIEGKLRAAGSRLARHFDDPEKRLSAAGRPPRAGLALWLDARNGVTHPGQRVAAWKDRQRGLSFSQGKGELQPIFIERGPGGWPALRFDGKTLLHHETESVLPAGQPRTILVVGQASEAGPGGSLFAFRRGKPTFVGQQTLHQGRYYVYTDGANANGNSTLAANTINEIRQPFVAAYLAPGAGKKLSVHLNADVKNVTQPGNIGNDDGQPGFTVGNREDYAGYGWHGDISEILIYDRVLAADELEQAGTYLSTKYRLASKYPVKPIEVAADAQADRALITELYLAALSRYPTDQELASIDAHLRASSDRRRGLEDLFWAVLNSKEFLFQH